MFIKHIVLTLIHKITVLTPGLLISGGSDTSTSVEVFVPSTGQSCSLPPLPDSRWSHTSDGLYICGGQNTPSCLHFSSGQWNISHTLVVERRWHSSWQTDQGIVLMGGYGSLNTSEVVPTAGGQGGTSFDLFHNIE